MRDIFSCATGFAIVCFFEALTFIALSEGMPIASALYATPQEAYKSACSLGRGGGRRRLTSAHLKF